MNDSENILMSPSTAQLLLAHTFDAVFMVDESHIIQYVNPVFEQISRYESNEIVGKSITILNIDHQSDKYFRKIFQLAAGGKKPPIMIINQKKNGDLFYLNTHIIPLQLPGSERLYLFIGCDVTPSIYQASTADVLKKELTYLEQEFDTILYNISHNLRAPVATIKGIVELSRLEDSGLTTREYCRLVEENVEQMDLILSDILRLSLVKNSRSVAKEVDFDTLIRSILKSLSKFYPVASFDVTIDISDNLCPVIYEELLIKSALRPVIENAIQFRKPTDKKDNAFHHINISVSNTPKEIVLSVADNGIGIDESVQERIFDIFYKGTPRSKGNGLGLYIVKTAVLRLNGQVELKSKKYEGTTVTIKLPKFR